MSKGPKSVFLNSLRQEARSLQDREECTYSKALDQVARNHGYSRWSALTQTSPESVDFEALKAAVEPGAAPAPIAPAELRYITPSKVKAIIGLTEVLNGKRGGPTGNRLSIGVGEDADAVFQAQFKEEFRRTYGNLYDAVAALTHDERMELMAIMWIGRDFEGEFAAALAYAYKNSDYGDTGYITGKSVALANFLRRGLSKIGAS